MQSDPKYGTLVSPSHSSSNVSGTLTVSFNPCLKKKNYSLWVLCHPNATAIGPGLSLLRSKTTVFSLELQGWTFLHNILMIKNQLSNLLFCIYFGGSQWKALMISLFFLWITKILQTVQLGKSVNLQVDNCVSPRPTLPCTHPATTAIQCRGPTVLGPCHLFWVIIGRPPVFCNFYHNKK